jgi:aminoglycoside phosphotransferase family enzyme/predicted kinase
MFQRVVEFLSRPSAYSDTPDVVDVIETHISYVFLTDRNAYKLKKPVKFNFLDFSTPALRHAACLEELRLNRRLAPDVYLAVLPVTEGRDGALQLGGGGTELDFVVQMRRLPADKAMGRMMRENRLSTVDVRIVADFLAEFYAKLPSQFPLPGDYRRALERQIRENQSVLLQSLPDDHARIRRIHSAQLRYLQLNNELTDKRVCTGRVVDGHGDLRPEHIYLEDPPTVIDCVEFSEDLRRVDTADELNFLAMECDCIGHSEVGEIVLSTYEQVCGDKISQTLSRFYRSYRACVRAKVTLIQGQQHSNNRRQSLRRLTRRYLDWADHYALSLGRPCLIVIFGLMGTGKSTLARKLAAAFDIEYISTDHIRRSMFGASPSPSRYGEGLYRPDERARIYDEQFRQACRILDEGQSVILDGSFLTRDRRYRANEIGRRHGAVAMNLQCECPADTAIARIRKRIQLGGSESEARVDLYEAQARELQEPTDDESVIRIDTISDLSQQTRAIFDALHDRLFVKGAAQTG